MFNPHTATDKDSNDQPSQVLQTVIIEPDTKLVCPTNSQPISYFQNISLEEDEINTANTEKKYKKRLLIGEADLSFTYALLKKHEYTHPNLHKFLTVTCYESEADLEKRYKNFAKHRDYLKSLNVRLLFNVDAQKLHIDDRLRHEKFERIHFNFPHDGNENYDEGTLKQILANFFKSAVLLQEIGDEIKMALPCPPDNYKRNDPELTPNAFYKGKLYDLYTNTRFAGYQLAEPKYFGEKRYTLYGHVKTKVDESATVAEHYPKEYIFEKTDLSPEEIHQQEMLRNPQPILDDKLNTYLLPEPEAKEESSDYIIDELVKIREEILQDKYTVEKKLSRLKSLITKHLNYISSIELTLTDNQQEHIYSQIDPLGWKKHITNCYYNCQNVRYYNNKITKFPECADKYIDMLIYIIEKCYANNLAVTHTALNSLFYLNNNLSENIINKLSLLALRQDVYWDIKASLLRILMTQRQIAKYRENYIIPTLLKNIFYDGRLSWLTCSFLGWFDLKEFIIDPKLKTHFDNITDYRLIYRLLKSSNCIFLMEKTDLLPNRHYRMIIKYIHFKNVTLHQCETQTPEIDEEIREMELAISVPIIASPHYKLNRITHQFELESVALIDAMFLPGTSIKRTGNNKEEICLSLQGRHQTKSYKAIAYNYLHGLNGCKQNHNKALQFYLVAANFGSIKALFEIIKLYSQGHGDYVGISPDQLIVYCKNMIQLSTLSNMDKSIIHCCWGLMHLLQNDIKQSELHLDTSITFNKLNSFASLYNLFLKLLATTPKDAKEILSKIEETSDTIKYVKNVLLALLNRDKDQTNSNLRKLNNSLQTRPYSNKFIMHIFCGLYFYKRGHTKLSQTFYNRANEIHPKNMLIPYLLKLMISPGKELNQETIKYNIKHNYNLMFTQFSCYAEFEQKRTKLQLKSKKFKGYICYIHKNKDEFDVIFMDECISKTIHDQHIRNLTAQLINKFTLLDSTKMYKVMQEIYDSLYNHIDHFCAYENPSYLYEEIFNMVRTKDEPDEQEKEQEQAELVHNTLINSSPRI